MHSPDDDRLLRDAFDELRRADLERTPPFQPLWKTGNPACPDRRDRLASTRFALAACLILLLVATTTVVMLRRAQTTSVTSIPIEWKGPTDFLLVTPGSELGSSIPQLPSPVPQYSLKGIAK